MLLVCHTLYTLLILHQGMIITMAIIQSDVVS